MSKRKGKIDRLSPPPPYTRPMESWEIEGVRRGMPGGKRGIMWPTSLAGRLERVENSLQDYARLLERPWPPVVGGIQIPPGTHHKVALKILKDMSRTAGSVCRAAPIDPVDADFEKAFIALRQVEGELQENRLESAACRAIWLGMMTERIRVRCVEAAPHYERGNRAAKIAALHKAVQACPDGWRALADKIISQLPVDAPKLEAGTWRNLISRERRRLGIVV